MHKVSQLVLELLFVAFILGFCWVSNCWLKLFLLIQKAAGTVLTGGFRRDPVCPVLASLQWLPVKFGIQFKILLTTSKALTGFAPSYITDLTVPNNQTRTLCSLTACLLVVQRISISKIKGSAFSFQASLWWNHLPVLVHNADSFTVFWTKTLFFEEASIYPFLYCFISVFTNI